jgi:hypothetical protein
MAVNLSMLAGAGAQFFDNSGVILSGGLVYTYAAGTTTPQTTYTTSAGNVAHTNPIVLDSAGRVASGGEIWLTDAVAYKFVLKTSAAVTIGTYDNVTGNASGVASGIYAAFAAPSGSSLIGYLPAGAVPTTVQAKLRQSINAVDFGVTANGSTDDTAAMQAAINYSISSDLRLILPAGSIKITAPLTINLPCQIQGQGRDQTKLIVTSAFSTVLYLNGGNAGINIDILDLQIDTQGYDTRCVLVSPQIASLWPITFQNCQFYGTRSGGLVDTSGILNTFIHCQFFANGASTVAINFIDNSQNSTIESCLFFGLGKGVVISTAGGVPCEGIRILNSVFACPKTSVTIGGASGYTKLIGNIFDQVLNEYVVYITAGSYLTEMTNNYFGGAVGNTSALLFIDPGTFGQTIIGNTFAQGSIGIQVAANSLSHESYLTIDNNTFANITTVSLQLDSVVQCQITSNMDIGSPTSGSYTTIATDDPGNYIFDNNYWSTNPILNFDSTSTYYWGNDEGVYGRRISETVAGAPGTTLTITHGLIRTPTNIRFSINAGATNPGGSWISAITSTTFTVSWTNSATVTVYWDAQV